VPEQIGVHFKMDEHWHLYWQNPGDSGSAPKFSLIKGEITRVQWPYPERIEVSSLTNYGYNNEVVIFLDVKGLAPDSSLELEWLVCKVECIPGFATLPINAKTLQVRPLVYGAFQKRLPNPSLWSSEFQGIIDNSFRFHLRPAHGLTIHELKSLDIFPKNKEYFSNSSPIINPLDDSLEIRLAIAPNGSESQESEDFTVVTGSHSGDTSSFDLTVDKKVSYASIIVGMLLAVVGGILLNIMPCVFPVLFLKAFSFLKAESQVEIRRSSWIYTAGVLTSFLAIGCVLVLLRLSGESIGWGFHLQSPVIVLVLALLFFVMGLMFLDVIKIDRFVGSLRWTKYSALSGDFGTGVLAVVVASPCTAPFMGTALGMTLFLPAWQSIVIFLSLGLGLALPILVFAHWPQLVRLLPRSGSWMITFKKFLTIPLFATSAWLIWVFSMQMASIHQVESSKNWEIFNPQTIEVMNKERPVFIDFTAAWCITCQVNKKTVLESDEIMTLFQRNNVYLVRADWTNHSPEITKQLAHFGRNSVPLYVYYEKGSKDAKVLPEILTKGELYKLFNEGN
jgi:thiol:disulfide interchange protein DsbD